MQKPKLILVGMILLLVFFTFGCGEDSQSVDNEKMKIGELNYEIVDTSAENLPGGLAEWYQDNYKKEGLHSTNLDGGTYLLVSAGEKPTGGYEIQKLVLTGTDQVINVSASLRVPGKDEMVTEALTYPSILVKIPKDSREFELAELTENAPEKHEVKKDTGTYVGQIDNNSIEIKISGVPEEKAAKVFRLEDKVKDNFQHFELETDDQVLFSYFENNDGQLVLTSIEKIHN